MDLLFVLVGIEFATQPRLAWRGIAWLVVILDLGGRYFSLYAHLSSIDVEPGGQLATGTRLGSSGATGSLSGPQLYFEIRRGKEALDPAIWLGGSARGAGMG